MAVTGAAPIDYKKDPDDVLDVIWDWWDWTADGETLSTSEFITTPGLTIDRSEYTTKSATVWLSGGTEGRVYRVTNRVTTSGGRKIDRSITVRCEQR